jgi:hypothetical protein
VPKLLAVDLVTVAQEIGGRGVVREGVHNLLGRPGRGGMLGDIEVDDTPTVMGEHDEDEEDTQAGGGYCEEIDRDQVSDVVVEERPPGLGGLGTTLRHEAGHGALGDIDAELQELAMDSWRAPEKVGSGHSGDQSPDLGIDARATCGRVARELGPILAEPSPLPSQDGVGRDDHERLLPPGPDVGKADPEEAVTSA